MPLQRSLAVWTASLSMCAVDAHAGASLFVDDAPWLTLGVNVLLPN